MAKVKVARGTEVDVGFIEKINWRTISFIFLIVISMAVQIIGQAMLNIGLGWETDINRIIIRNALNAISIVLIVFGIIFYMIGEFKAKDTDYVRMAKEIMQWYYSVFKQIIWDTFKETVNRKRKIRQWKVNLIAQENKLDTLNKKDKINGLENRRIWFKGTEKERADNVFCQKKALLREQGSDEWIKANIDYIYVKYDEITYSAIFIGKVKSNDTIQANDFISKNDTLVIVVENLPRVMIGVGLMMFLSSLIYDGLQFGTEFYINSLFVVLGLAWNIFLARNYGKNFCATRILGSMMFRHGVADQYKNHVAGVIVKEPDNQEVKAIVASTLKPSEPKVDEPTTSNPV